MHAQVYSILLLYRRFLFSKKIVVNQLREMYPIEMSPEDVCIFTTLNKNKFFQVCLHCVSISVTLFRRRRFRAAVS